MNSIKLFIGWLIVYICAPKWAMDVYLFAGNYSNTQIIVTGIFLAQTVILIRFRWRLRNLSSCYLTFDVYRLVLFCFAARQMWLVFEDGIIDGITLYHRRGLWRPRLCTGCGRSSKHRRSLITLFVQCGKHQLGKRNSLFLSLYQVLLPYSGLLTILVMITEH